MRFPWRFPSARGRRSRRRRGTRWAGGRCRRTTPRCPGGRCPRPLCRCCRRPSALGPAEVDLGGLSVLENGDRLLADVDGDEDLLRDVGKGDLGRAAAACAPETAFAVPAATTPCAEAWPRERRASRPSPRSRTRASSWRGRGRRGFRGAGGPAFCQPPRRNPAEQASALWAFRERLPLSAPPPRASSSETRTRVLTPFGRTPRSAPSRRTPSRSMSASNLIGLGAGCPPARNRARCSMRIPFRVAEGSLRPPTPRPGEARYASCRRPADAG